MSDLDGSNRGGGAGLDTGALRRALRASAGAWPGLGDPLDVAAVMTSGRRVRRRRRLAVAGGCLCAAMVLGGTGAAVAHLAAAPSAQVQPAGPGGRLPSEPAARSPSPVPKPTNRGSSTGGSGTTAPSPTASPTATGSPGRQSPATAVPTPSSTTAAGGGTPVTAGESITAGPASVTAPASGATVRPAATPAPNPTSHPADAAS